MTLLDAIAKNKLDEAKKLIFGRLNALVEKRLEEAKKYVAADRFDEAEEESLEEAYKRNPNIIRMGRVKKIRRRIRRNAKGRIVVQKNRRRSAIKGYRISGNTVRRVPATTRLKKARLLRRSWKTTRRAKLRRSQIKRRMSMRRRSSLGLK
jgi:hypothetical protein